MSSTRSLVNNQSWCEWIMNAIEKIKVSRQCPTFHRICQTIRKRHICPEETIAARLKEAEKSGLIEAVLLRGDLVYRLVQCAEKQIRNEMLSPKQCPVPNVLCSECLRTSTKGPDNLPEPMSSCERCGISLHDSCSNKSNGHETSVPLSQLVSVGNRWFCEECNQCDACDSPNDSLCRARRCLVECGAGCGKKYHFQCMVPTVKGPMSSRLPWCCGNCSRHGEPNGRGRYEKRLRVSDRSSPTPADMNRLKASVVYNKISGKCAKRAHPEPSEAELIDGRIAAMKIKLASIVTGDDLDVFRQVLLQRSTLQVDNLQRTPSAIRFGKYEIETWYSSPFPQEYAKLKVLFLCEFCLKYMKTGEELRRHQHKCSLRHPPGSEIYHDGVLSVFEVDGNLQKLYCQSLCLLAKLFLDHKTLYFDVEPFMFYILTRRDNLGYHIVGYFSKEKANPLSYNVSCILTMPQHQRQGYGRFLIDFSYLLSRVEQKPGTPERPLSDLGRLSYHQYWTSMILSYLYLNRYGPFTLDAISRDSGMIVSDVITTLRKLHFIRFHVQKTGCIRINRPVLCIDWRLVDDHYSRMQRSANCIKVKEMCLRWTPKPKLEICSPVKSEKESHEATVKRSAATKSGTQQVTVAQSPSEENSNDTEYSAGEHVVRTSSGRKRSRPRKYSESFFDLSLSTTTGTPKSNRGMKPSPEEPKSVTFGGSAFPIARSEARPVIVSVQPEPFIRIGTDEEISLDSVEAFMGTPKSELHRSPPNRRTHGFSPIAPFRQQSGANDDAATSTSSADGFSHRFAPNISTPKSRVRTLDTDLPGSNGRTISRLGKRTTTCVQQATNCKRQRLEWPASGKGNAAERDTCDPSVEGTLTSKPQVTLLELCRPTRLSGRGSTREGTSSEFNLRVLPQTV